MQRWHKEESRYKRRLEEYNGFWGYHRYDSTHLGRARKRSLFDCGNSECQCCHSDKYPRRQKTRNELKSDLSFKEQLND